MKEFLESLNEKMQRFMEGRNGTDDLSKFLIVVSMVLFFLSLLAQKTVFYFAAILVLVYAWYRMLSRNFAVRAKENSRYRHVIEELARVFRVQKKRFDGRRDFRFFKCPGCGQEVRVPKGKGHIRITCPKCRTQFDRTV